MTASQILLFVQAASAALVLSGCQFVPKTQLAAAESHVRTLAEQNKALLAEIENRKQHVEHMENRVRRAEEDLALLEEELGTDRRRLVNFEREREQLKKRVGTLANHPGKVPLGVSARLADLADHHPALKFDPETGIAKFDNDVLFGTADDQLRPEAQHVLAGFAQIFQDTNARDLKIMVVGHTDDRGVAKKPTRDRFQNNWELSTARALAVANYLRKSGLPEDRMGVAGFAGYQPIASNTTDPDRLRNRRVEIFVLGPETPVVGWSDTTPNVYR